MECNNELQKKLVSIFKIVRNTLTDAMPLIFPHNLKNTARFPSILVTCVSSRIVPTVRSPKGWLGARSGASKCGNVVMPTVLVMGWMNITLAFICEGKMLHFRSTILFWHTCTIITDRIRRMGEGNVFSQGEGGGGTYPRYLPSPGQDSIWSTWYAAVGMPLGFTQEDIFV